MKIKLITPYLILILAHFFVSYTGVKTNKNIWPTIKGIWWPLNNGSGEIINMQRRHIFGSSYFNFISKDSIELGGIQYDDKKVKEIVKWESVADTIKIYGKKTSIIIILKLTDNELSFKPL